MSPFAFLAIRVVRATNVQNLRAVRKFPALELTQVHQIPNSGALPSVSSVPSVVRWLRLGRAGQSVVHCFRRSYTGSGRALEPAALRVFVRLPGRAEEAGEAVEVSFRQVAKLPGV